MAQFTFWTSLALIAYAYFGYPILLYVLAGIRSRPVLRRSIEPTVSIIIAAYNEERGIRQKIEDTLALEYPNDKRTIIVASDGSIDQTNEIVSEYAEQGVRLIACPDRKGKEQAQWEAIQVAKGEILVFSDASTLLERQSLRQILSNFHDPGVGCVSSEDRVLGEENGSGGEGMYVKYEMWLRQLESRVGSLIGLSGSYFAVRKELCKDWVFDQDSDFLTAFRAVRQGYRAISDPSAIAYYRAVPTAGREFKRKVRTVLRGIAGVVSHLEVLNPIKYRLFAVQVLSHKLLRWLVPMCMVTALVSNAVLAQTSHFYLGIVIGQLVFYSLAILGLLSKQLGRFQLFKVPAFFTMVNASIAVAWMQYFAGHRAIRWEPSQRT